MITLLFVLALAGDSAAAAPAPVAPAVVTAAPAVETKKERDARLKQEKLDRVVCKRVVPTGSRMSVQECHPQWEWDQIRDATNKALDNMQEMAQGRMR